MNINALISTVILVSFIVTVVLAVGSYMAYKVRERRRPRSVRAETGDGPVFFERFFPQTATPVVATEGETGERKR
jgi:heme/copper-type cytochrome/quinol oxidase subunit 2